MIVSSFEWQVIGPKKLIVIARNGLKGVSWVSKTNNLLGVWISVL